MPRHLTHPLLPPLTLIALVLFTPTLATALPQGATICSAAERAEAAPSVFAKLWGFLSVFWANGSGLDPDGATGDNGPGLDPNGATGDNGSGLEPNG